MRIRRLGIIALASILLAAPATTTPAQAAIIPIPPSSAITSLPLPTHPLRPSADPVELAVDTRPLPVTYQYGGATHTLDSYLQRSTTQGFAVLDGQTIVHERYLLANASTPFQSWSVGKSFTSAAVGISLAEGSIASVDDPVTRYLPALKGTGYDGISIRDLLRMASGIAWNEVSDVPVTHLRASLGASYERMAAERVRGVRPGTAFNYTSMNTFVLAWLVSAATGQPFHRYVEQRIWRPAGMAGTAYLGSDFYGAGLGYCCYYATVRDFARFGLLYLNGGQANGRQVVPASWVKESTTPSAPFNQPTATSLGYGLQWWLGDQGDYLAVGLGGQHIYVSARYGVVIAQNTVASTLPSMEALAAFRAVAAEVAATRSPG